MSKILFGTLRCLQDKVLIPPGIDDIFEFFACFWYFAGYNSNFSLS